jgi:hypothetical protein
MANTDLPERLNEAGLRLSDAELVPFRNMVATMDRIAAWVRETGLSYADEPATHFQAPRG